MKRPLPHPSPSGRGGHAKKHSGSGQIRLIGGQFRGRKLLVAEGEGLRPTPSRVRETLFNWLAAPIEGACVLDVFAGSGALSLEALSRGARKVLALDKSSAACRTLQENAQILKTEDSALRCVQADSLQYLRTQTPAQPFAIAFLDPPFAQGLLAPAAQLLEQRGWLSERALIYCESESPAARLGLPENWQALREKQAGQVHYSLWQRGKSQH